MRAIDARPLAATSAALTTGGARAAAWFWSRSSAAMRLVGAIADGCQDAWESWVGSDEALCLSSLAHAGADHTLEPCRTCSAVVCSDARALSKIKMTRGKTRSQSRRPRRRRVLLMKLLRPHPTRGSTRPRRPRGAPPSSRPLPRPRRRGRSLGLLHHAGSCGASPGFFRPPPPLV